MISWEFEASFWMALSTFNLNNLQKGDVKTVQSSE